MCAQCHTAHADEHAQQTPLKLHVTSVTPELLTSFNYSSPTLPFLRRFVHCLAECKTDRYHTLLVAKQTRSQYIYNCTCFQLQLCSSFTA